jgi:hypothetical protein
MELLSSTLCNSNLRIARVRVCVCVWVCGGGGQRRDLFRAAAKKRRDGSQLKRFGVAVTTTSGSPARDYSSCSCEISAADRTATRGNLDPRAPLVVRSLGAQPRGCRSLGKGRRGKRFFDSKSKKKRRLVLNSMEFKFKLSNRPRSLLEHWTSYSCCALVGRLVKTDRPAHPTVFTETSVV